MMILSNEFPLVWNRNGQIHAVVSNDELVYFAQHVVCTRLSQLRELQSRVSQCVVCCFCYLCLVCQTANAALRWKETKVICENFAYRELQGQRNPSPFLAPSIPEGGSMPAERDDEYGTSYSVWSMNLIQYTKRQLTCY